MAPAINKARFRMAGYANFVISILFLAGAVMLGLIAAYDPREAGWETRVAAEAFIALVFCVLAVAKLVHALEIMRIARAETPESLLTAAGDDALRRRANLRAAGEMLLFLLAMASGALLFENTTYRVAIAAAALLMMVGPVYRIVRWGRAARAAGAGLAD